MNIILIVSDTLRQDHLGCYGNKEILTPCLDKFARERCIQFDNCYAASFPTMPNRADLFTGKYTFTYLGWAPLPLEEKILAETLLNAGYATTAAVDTPFFLRRGYGYDRGFEDFVWIPGQGSERPRIDSGRRFEQDFCAPKTMSTAERLLQYYYRKNFFLYVDTWDPHEPWDPPTWRVEPYYPDYSGQIVHPCYWDWREAGLEEEDIKVAHACYCGEISMMDSWVGRLLDRIESLGILDNTVILFTSDHGFYFGEHGYFGKCKAKGKISSNFYATGRESGESSWYRSPLYREITRIPLLIYIPGISPRRIKAAVSSVDIMPTLLELAKVEIPETVQGQSLVALIRGTKRNLHDFVVTSQALYSPGEKTRMVDDLERMIKEGHASTITWEKWTFVYTMEGERAELYNMESDPSQSQNVIYDNWQVAKEMHHEFVNFLEKTGTDESKIAPRRTLSKL